MSLSSNFPTSKPSLNLDFANVGALDPRITFTRSSSATYTNSLGLIATAATNVARFDYDPSTLAARGLLVEEQRTNLLPASNDFSNVTYWTGGGSVIANATTSPDGTVNAAIGYGIYPASGLGNATVPISGSIFAKANPSGASSLVLRINRFGSGTDYLEVTFNLSTGVVGAVTNSGTASSGSASMVAFGSGWYRCVLSGTVSTTAGTLSFNPQSDCFIYGAQLEAASFPTSYIPTSTGAVTRSADVASVNTLSPWFNATEGTIFAEFDFIGLNPASPGVNQGVACFTDGTAASNNLGLLGYGDGSASRSGFVFSGSSQVAFLGGSASSVNTTYKSALAAKANDFRLVNSGGSVISDTSGAMSTGMNQLLLGNLYTTTNPTYQNGHLRRVAYYPRALTTAELQALTS